MYSSYKHLTIMYDLTGKVVIITGGASGIGFHCVKELLHNGVQAVTIADVNAVEGEKAVRKLTKEFGHNKVIFVKMDVTTSGQLDAAFKVTLQFWKTIDVVINNAAVANDNDWEYEIALNCNGVVQGTLLGLQYMGKDQGGKGGIIVNMASTWGLEPYALLPIYVGTKHFVMGFSRSIADPYNYNQAGVNILMICPGRTFTNLLTDLFRRPLNLSMDIGEQLFEEIHWGPQQSVKSVAEGMVTLIKKGKNGSVWLVDGNKPIYQVEIPHWSTYDVVTET